MRGMFSRIRFLPVTIFAASLMLTVKVSDIWKGVEGMTSRSLEVAGAAAQTAESEAPQSLMPADEETAAFGGAENEPDFAGGDSGFDFSEDEADAAAELLVTQDPTLLTQAEIELLQRLAGRREELDNREREIDQRAALLEAAEGRINNKIRQLQSFQVTIEGLIKTYDEQQEAKMGSLVKIYESMKPKQAALILEDLDMDTLLLVAERMKERKLSDIMAKMNPEKARDVTVELSRMRDLPGAGTTTGG